MRHVRCTHLSLALLFLCAEVSSTAAQSVRLPILRQELLHRAKEDQRVRAEMPDDPSKITPAHLARVQTVDRANTAYLKRVVRRYGWPGKRLAGDDGAHAAWILLQHADHAPAFQKQCLKVMEKAVRRGDASGQDYAYLLDRVLTGEGKPQMYGTQVKFADGQYVPLPIADEANVDRRRAVVGLPPLAE